MSTMKSGCEGEASNTDLQDASLTMRRFYEEECLKEEEIFVKSEFGSCTGPDGSSAFVDNNDEDGVCFEPSIPELVIVKVKEEHDFEEEPAINNEISSANEGEASNTDLQDASLTMRRFYEEECLKEEEIFVKSEFGSCTGPDGSSAFVENNDGKKSYPCTLCHFKATQPGTLSRHMRTHSEVSVYEITPKRARLAPALRWSKPDVHKLLEAVRSLGGDLFEKPTAQVYYSKIMLSEASLAKFTWTAMRDKIRNLKAKYKTAIDWRNNTGAGIDEPGNETTIRETILKLCPEFDAMDETFGARPSFNPIYNFDSDVQVSSEIVITSTSSPTPVEGTNADGVSYMDARRHSPMNETPITPLPPPEKPGTQEPNQAATSFAQFKSQWAKKSETRDKTPNSSISQLTLMNQSRFVYLHELNKLEREKFEWQMKREQQHLDLERCRMEAEIRLKEAELSNSLQVEKLKIEAQLELQKFALELKYKHHKHDSP